MDAKPKIKVMVIDDDADWQILLADQFADTDECEVVSLFAYDEKVFEIFAPDLVIVDILLGNENGLDVLKKIWSKTKSQSAILISSCEEAVKEVKRKGVPVLAIVKGIGMEDCSGPGLVKLYQAMCSK